MCSLYQCNRTIRLPMTPVTKVSLTQGATLYAKSASAYKADFHAQGTLGTAVAPATATQKDCCSIMNTMQVQGNAHTYAEPGLSYFILPLKVKYCYASQNMTNSLVQPTVGHIHQCGNTGLQGLGQPEYWLQVLYKI